MRSVSQIYSEAVAIRNNYLQLTELNTGRSNSKLSIINLMTYVVAVCIHTYEAILDIFQLKLAEVLNGRINGTPDWYAAMAKKFQYNDVNAIGDAMKFDEDTLQITYVQKNTSHQIIEKSAWQMYEEDDQALLLKVCKANPDTNEVNSGLPYSPLSAEELTAFRLYIQQIKFVGAVVYSESSPGDIITIVADKYSPIFYDDNYITAAQAMSNLQQAMIDYVNEMEYNDIVYYQSIIDALQKTEHIVSIGSETKIYIESYNDTYAEYDEPVKLINRIRLKSGFLRLLDTNSAMTINSANITLVPASQFDSYNPE